MPTILHHMTHTFLSSKKFQIKTFFTVSFWDSFFSCNSSKLSPVSRDIQSVFIYCNINFENSLNTKFSFLLLDYTLKTVRSTLLNCSFNVSASFTLHIKSFFRYLLSLRQNANKRGKACYKLHGISNPN